MAYNEKTELWSILDKHRDYIDLSALSIAAKFMTGQMHTLFTTSSGNYFHQHIPGLLKKTTSCKEEEFEFICGAVTREGKKNEVTEEAVKIIASLTNLRKLLALKVINFQELFPDLPPLKDAEKFFTTLNHAEPSCSGSPGRGGQRNQEEYEGSCNFISNDASR